MVTGVLRDKRESFGAKDNSCDLPYTYLFFALNLRSLRAFVLKLPVLVATVDSNVAASTWFKRSHSSFASLSSKVYFLFTLEVL